MSKSSMKAAADAVGAPESEPTSAMVEAGLIVLWESGSLESPSELLDRVLVRKIYRAMREQDPSH